MNVKRLIPGIWMFILLGTAQPMAAQVDDKPIPPTKTDSVAIAVDSLGVSDSMKVPHPFVDSGSAITYVDSLGQALADSIFAEVSGQFQQILDSMKKENARLKHLALRRLNIDIFVDSFRSHHFYSCVIDPRKAPLRLYNKMEGRIKRVHTFESLSLLAEKQGKRLPFAMNAGMYERNRLAKGLLVMDGQVHQRLDTLREGYGNFYMQPNGVFALDSTGTGYVIPTQAYPQLAKKVKIKWATQSGPMLVVNGEINPLFNDGSPNLHIRNAVGITPDNEVVFAISARRVTFFELASFMIKQGCTNALYLDGAISQAYMPSIGVGNIYAGGHLGPIFVIFN